ncbi:MAG: ABC transporter permease subunit, partial [Acidobacteria bacterium]|nr:ABC transporter permease subunit [Acidobacteriota bacterium]
MTHRARSRFLSNPSAMAGACLLAVVGAAALVAPWLAPHDPLAVDLSQNLQGASAAHPLGTDHLGRDTLSRLLFGARVSLLISIVAVTGALLAGVAAGLAAAWYRGAADAVFVRAMDVLLAFPEMLMAIAVIAVLGPGDVSTIVAVAAYALPQFARLTRAAALTAVSRESLLAARAAGAGSVWI